MSNTPKRPIAKTALLSFQHVFAMFGATVLVPMLTGLSTSATLMFAGLGTLLFHFLTKRKVPAFLGSSFAFLAGYFYISSMVSDYNAAGLQAAQEAAVAAGQSIDSAVWQNVNWVPYAGVGVLCAGLMYVLVSQLFRVFGAKRVMRFFPPIVTGPIIICVGMNLAYSAVNNCSGNWLVAIVAVVTVVVCNIWGKGMLKIVPILMGVVVSYVFAVCLGTVDFTPVSEAAWVGIPFKMEDTAFSLFGGVNGGLLVSSILAMVPLSLATMIEHIGDMCAISSTVGKDFVADPGLHRTLLGDGLATSLAAAFGAPANTTYGENTGVLALTKVYDPFVVRMAAVIALVFSFCPKFSAIIGCMPAPVIGGVSLILYGMISAVGVRNVVENHVDFTKSRNVIIAALILSLDLGIQFAMGAGATIAGGVQNTGAIKFAIGSVNISLSGLAVAAIIGILLNAILPGNDYEFGKNPAGDKNRGIHIPADGE